jgi:hypothetical protein
MAMSMSPDDIVRLDGRGDMTAKSAVRIVMQEWSAEQRAGAKITEQVIIFRGEEPFFLRIGQIEELWLRPEFRD